MTNDQINEFSAKWVGIETTAPQFGSIQTVLGYKLIDWCPTSNVVHALALMNRTVSIFASKRIDFDFEYGLDKKTGWNCHFDGKVYETWSPTMAEAITKSVMIFVNVI